MRLQLKKCAVGDLDLLLKIAKETFRVAFEEVNNPEDFENYLETAFNREKLKIELKSTDTSFYFVLEEQALVGYFKLNEGKGQTDIAKEHTMELERIYVLQKFQGMGIGKRMIEEIKIMAKEKQKTYLWLGVWEQNTRAIAFYEKQGFSKFGKHPYFIGKDKQMDWLMRVFL